MLLHKYTKAMHGLSYLRNGYLRFSPLAEFNDPFEMHPYLNSLGTPEQEAAVVGELEDEDPGFRCLSNEVKTAVLQNVRTRGLEEMREWMLRDFTTLGVLSLVKDRRQDLLMWAHYAENHKGCVLEFDSTHEWFTTKHGSNRHELLGVLHEVRYSPTRPQVSLLDLGKKDLLTKAECWGYENEWRILLNLRDCTTQTHGEKEVNGLFLVPREALTSVYLGVNIDPKDQEQFLDLLPPGDRVELFQFRQDEQDYALVAQQINT